MSFSTPVAKLLNQTVRSPDLLVESFRLHCHHADMSVVQFARMQALIKQADQRDARIMARRALTNHVAGGK